ncbi:LIC11966 family surface protein [Flavobacterium sp.]
MNLRLLLIFFLATSTSLFAQEFKSAVDYLTYIEKEQGLIAKSTWKYTTAVAHSKSARRIDNTRKLLLKSIDAAQKKISALKEGYKGDVEYRNQVLQYLDVSKININEEYEKLIDMQEVAEQSYDAMEAYLLMRDKINEKLDAENEKVNNAFKSFALKYNITVTEGNSALGEKIKLSNEVFDYHTALYLIFFKVSFTDGNLVDAIEKKDLSAIQQNASSLILYADEGLGKLKEIKPYNGDSSMINVTKKALEYYKKQALQYVPKIVDFVMFNDKFENARKNIEAKSAKDRSSEEIDNYNTMVKQANKEIDNYNKLNNSNYQEKNNVLNEWNTVGDNFISGHIPVD